MRILLHICCAPCAIHPFQELSGDGENSVTGFFYNPNIHPFSEMEKRRQAVADYGVKADFTVIFAEYNVEDFFKRIANNTQAPLRCHICWKMRLGKTAQYAKKEGFDAFASTLLVSPYQDREAIVKIGSEVSSEFGVTFLGNDWRGGFRQAQQFARENDIYRQKYCGCIFSEKERFRKSTVHRP